MQAIDRIHLDLIGGISGDMFAAALADAFPETVPGLLAQLAKLGASKASAPRIVAHSDGVIHGRRFLTDSSEALQGHEPHGESQGVHGHVAHRDLQRRLREAGLDSAVLHHAVSLFEELAAAESAVHGIPKDEVEFHEVGAWDSIMDFVAAAYFIATLAPRAWTWSAPPLGGGRVRTAHGVLPVPAPATAILLQGMEVFDDGVQGERVTPTGAAILKHLRGLSEPAAAAAGRYVLVASGSGHGTRRIPGIANIVRCLAFARSPSLGESAVEEIASIQFEIDDQTSEDLAVALDRIREVHGVIDVFQAAVFGKKGRLAIQVQVLARQSHLDRVAETCLAETSTLGLRIARVCRRVLARTNVPAQPPDSVRVKVAQRPCGELTSKAEMDDLARIEGGRAEREAARRRAERRTIDTITGNERGNRSDD